MAPLILAEALVLDTIANDYESLSTLIEEVSEWGREQGINLGRSDIVSSLGILVEHQLAEAFILSPREPAKPLVGMPVLAEIDEAFFLSTEAGRLLVTEILPAMLDSQQRGA